MKILKVESLVIKYDTVADELVITDTSGSQVMAGYCSISADLGSTISRNQIEGIAYSRMVNGGGDHVKIVAAIKHVGRFHDRCMTVYLSKEKKSG